MVNAKKHKALKIFNAITNPERRARQKANNKKFYNKNKNLATSSTNWGTRPEAKILELEYGDKGA